MKTLITIVLALVCAGASAQGYSAGQKVEVYDREQAAWVASTVVEKNNNRLYIKYADNSWEGLVDPELLRRQGEKKDAPVYYSIGSTENFYKYYVTEYALVRYLTPDSAGIRFGTDFFTFRRQGTDDFLTAKQKIYESNLYLEWVDQNSFMISRSHNMLSYYHRDKVVGNRFMRSPELGQRVDSALVHIKKMESGAANRAAKSKADNEFNTVTNFMSTLTSKRTDAVLAEDAKKWWNSVAPCCPVMKVYFANADYSYKRNEYGIILHNYMRVIIAFKNSSNNKCYVKWFTLGYENTGGTTYSKEMKRWNLGDVSLEMNGMTVYPGQEYGVDCAAIKP